MNKLKSLGNTNINLVFFIKSMKGIYSLKKKFFLTAGFSTTLIHGMMYNPLTRRWSWISNSSVNYGLHAVKLHSGTFKTSTPEMSEKKNSMDRET